MGIAEGPDGSLYLSDSVKGKIWKITYDETVRERIWGDPIGFGMEERKVLSHIRTPHVIDDNLMKEEVSAGPVQILLPISAAPAIRSMEVEQEEDFLRSPEQIG